MNRFKIGDRVKVNDNYPSIDYRRKTGTVVEDLNQAGYYGVRLDDWKLSDELQDGIALFVDYELWGVYGEHEPDWVAGDIVRYNDHGSNFLSVVTREIDGNTIYEGVVIRIITTSEKHSDIELGSKVGLVRGHSKKVA